jgi:GT2 family glycosyltransferase
MPRLIEEIAETKCDLVDSQMCAPQVTCIVLNWNGWQDTLRCLEALGRCNYSRLSVVVIDNNSSDSSVDKIRAAYPDVVVLKSKTNLGFAGGNNIGIRYAFAHGADYVWLLNNDAWPSPDALSALVARSLSACKVGAVASICYFADSPQEIQAWGGSRVNLWVGYSKLVTDPQEDAALDALNGTSMLISRAALDEVGLLDEGFFLYWEDTELCFRLRKRGWRIVAAPASKVLHKVNGSTGGNPLILDRYQTASGMRIIRLHAPLPYLSLAMFVVMRFAKRLSHLQIARCRSVWEGMKDYWRNGPVVQKIY